MKPAYCRSVCRRPLPLLFYGSGGEVVGVQHMLIKEGAMKVEASCPPCPSNTANREISRYSFPSVLHYFPFPYRQPHLLHLVGLNKSRITVCHSIASFLVWHSLLPPTICFPLLSLSTCIDLVAFSLCAKDLYSVRNPKPRTLNRYKSPQKQ